MSIVQLLVMGLLLVGSFVFMYLAFLRNPIPVHEHEKFKRKKNGPGNSSRSRREEECLICCDGPPSVEILPCAHVCLCSRCMECLLKIDDRCPLCRVRIQDQRPVF